MFEVKTGYGYFKDSNDEIWAAAQLKLGTYPIKSGFTYHEVNTEKEFNELDIPQKAHDYNTEKRKVSRLVMQKLKKIALRELKAEGKVSFNYPEDMEG